MPKSVSPLREKALLLRNRVRLSNQQIYQVFVVMGEQVDPSTISRWVKSSPLRDEERKAKQKADTRTDWYRSLPESAHWKSSRKLTRQQKGKVAEAAVSLECLRRGFNVFASSYDGDRADRLVEVPSGNILKLQIKCCKHGTTGAPMIRLTTKGGGGKTRRYQKGEFDFIVGYDLRTEKVFVFSWSEVGARKATITVIESTLEAWHKLL